MKKKRVCLYFTPEAKVRLEKLAKIDRRSQSVIIEMMIDEAWLKKQEKLSNGQNLRN